MPLPVASRYVLDEAKRRTIIALVANGSSRRVAARYVGCAPSTISRTAARDPVFAEQLSRAEHVAEYGLLRCVQDAAKDPKHWRAGAWLLERRNPEDFAARPPRLFTAAEVADMLRQVVELLRGGIPEENCRVALQKLDEWIFDFQTAEGGAGEKGEEKREEREGKREEECLMSNVQ